jgi:hypothetical protein
MTFEGAGAICAALADMGVVGLRLNELPCGPDDFYVEIPQPTPRERRKMTDATMPPR